MSATTDRPIESIAPSDISGSFFEREGEHDPETLEDLAESLASEQEDPITVRPNGDGYEVVDGDRRVAAVEEYGDEYGIDTLLAEVRDLSKLEAARTLVTREEFREALSPVDIAELVAMVYEEKGTQQDTADWFNRTQPWVSDHLSILDMDEEVQEAVDDGDVSVNAAQSINTMDDKSDREQVVETVREEGLSEEETRDLIDQMEQDDSRATTVASHLDDLREKRERLAELEEQADEYHELGEEIEEIEDSLNEMKEDLPEDPHQRWEDYQAAQDERDHLETAIQLIEDFREQLEERAEDLALSDDESDHLTELRKQQEDCLDQIGDATVNVQENDDGTERVSIHVTYDPDDPPELIEQVVEVHEDLEEVRDEMEPLEERQRQASTAETNAQELPSDPARYLDLVDDPSAIDQAVRDTIRSYDGDTLGTMENDLEEVEETIEETDEDHLEELMDEYGEMRDEVEDLMVQKRQLQKRRKELSHAPGNVSRVASDVEELRDDARTAFQAMDDDTAEERFEQWSESYDFPLDFLRGDHEVTVEHTGGGWYEVASNGDSVKVRGEDAAEEVADSWRADGFEAAQEAKQDIAG